MAVLADIGLIGLGVMGQNLALNIAEHGFKVAVYNRTPERTESFLTGTGAAGLPLEGCSQLQDLAAALRRPRAVILMVQAGPATDPGQTHEISRLKATLDRKISTTRGKGCQE